MRLAAGRRTIIRGCWITSRRDGGTSMAAAATQLAKEPSRSRHRAKPKFDIPVAAAPVETPKASNGWVYRAEPEKAATSAAPLPPIAGSGPFEMIAEGTLLVGFGSL